MRHSHGMTGHELIAKIENAGFEARSYSGFGMYGDRCVAMVITSEDDDFGIPRGNFADSYGLDMIWYWPDVSWPSDVIERDEEAEHEDVDVDVDVEY